MHSTVSFDKKNNIPVIAETNLLVIGGGLAGIAAANEYVSKGKRAYIVESSICLGYEMTVCMRPWTYLSEQNDSVLADYFPVCSVTDSGSGTVSYTMKDLKCKFEDKMCGLGVDIIYASYPVAYETKNEKYFVTIANKSGLQGIYCDKIIDTTQSGLMASLGMGAPAHVNARFKDDTTSARITMEFTGIAKGYKPAYILPDEIEGVEGAAISVYQGAFSSDHVIVDIPLTIKNIDENCYRQDVYVEKAARDKCIEIAEYLYKEVPEFKNSLLGLISKKTLRSGRFDPVQSILQGEKMGAELSEDEKELTIKSVYTVETTELNNDYNPEKTNAGYEFSCDNDMAKIRGLDTVLCEGLTLPVIAESDVNVAGGGTSGAVSAVASAREGVKTTLVEMNHMLGGTGTVGGVNMYWMMTPFKYTKEIDAKTIQEQNRIGYPEKYLDYNWKRPSGEVITHQRPFSWSMEIKAKVLLDMCLTEDVEVFTESNIFAAIKTGGKVEGICFATAFGPFALLSKVTVDGTGDGDVAAFSGAEYVYGNTRDRFTMWTAMSPFDKPANYGTCFFVTGDVEDIIEFSNFVILSRKRPMDRKRYDHANMVSPRETRHITGELGLTLKDQFFLRKFPDTIHISYSNYDLKGKAMADVVILGIIPPAMDVEIPYRAIIPKKIDGLIMTGRGYSITHDALAAPRMQTDMQEFGASCGMAAALAVKNGVLPRNLAVRELQEKLVEQGSIWERVLEDRQYDYSSDSDAAEVIKNLTGDEKFSWMLMESDERTKEIPAVAKVYYADPKIAVPALLEEYNKSQGYRKTLLARMLAWHGNDTGIQDIVSHIKYLLNQRHPLPKVEIENHFAGTSPNQQNVPEVVFWLNAFSRTFTKEALPIYAELVERIHLARRNYKEKKASIFDYIECVAYTAERTGDKGFLPILKRLLELPELQGCVVTEGFEEDFYKERQAYLVMYIYRAMARCGEKEGLMGLCAFLEDRRMTLAKNSYIELMQLTGLKHVLDHNTWSKALESWPQSFEPKPWSGVVD